MGKDALVVLRLNQVEKNRIMTAARETGRSLTSFVLEATMHQVEKVEKAPKKSPKLFGACPSFFVFACATAKAGGEGGYANPAHELCRHLYKLGPDELETEDWEPRIDALRELLHSGGTDDEILSWFEENLPRCMALVPQRRRGSFVEGVRQFDDDQGIG